MDLGRQRAHTGIRILPIEEHIVVELRSAMDDHGRIRRPGCNGEMAEKSGQVENGRKRVEKDFVYLTPFPYYLNTYVKQKYRIKYISSIQHNKVLL